MIRIILLKSIKIIQENSFQYIKTILQNAYISETEKNKDAFIYTYFLVELIEIMYYKTILKILILLLQKKLLPNLLLYYMIINV